MRFCALAVIVIATWLAAAPMGQAAAERRCGDVTVRLPAAADGHRYEGSAVDIRGVGVTCRVARRVARACVHGRSGRWSHRGTRRVGQWDYIELERAGRRVLYRAAGGGGCS